MPNKASTTIIIIKSLKAKWIYDHHHPPWDDLLRQYIAQHLDNKRRPAINSKCNSTLVLVQWYTCKAGTARTISYKPAVQLYLKCVTYYRNNVNLSNLSSSNLPISISSNKAFEIKLQDIYVYIHNKPIAYLELFTPMSRADHTDINY